MTPTSAPSGLKLTEEQVETLLAYRPTGMCMTHMEQAHALTDWSTLRAACDEKDVEITRLKQDVERLHVDNYVLSNRRRDAYDRAIAAEARLAAMRQSTITDRQYDALVFSGCQCEACKKDRREYEAANPNVVTQGPYQKSHSNGGNDLG